MKKLLQLILPCTFLFMLLLSKAALAERLFKSFNTEAETVRIFTDRSLYIVGEQINFYAVVSKGKDSILSKILYCELVTPDGGKLSGGKFLIKKSSTHGSLLIPSDAVTGVYYVRAYTKLMRNDGPAFYGYKMLRIINPNRKDILAGDLKANEVLKSGTDSIKQNDGQLKVSLKRTDFLSHDTVNFSIQGINGFEPLKGVCLSVVPEAAAVSNWSITENKEMYHASKPMDYFPESKGISLTGKLTGPGQAPLREKRVNLSIMGDGRDFMSVTTDTAGRFFFALPSYSGSRDLFLCAEKTIGTDSKIWIDNDFCALPYSLPSPVFSLTERERSSALNMAMNMQIDSAFNHDSIQETVEVKRPLAFYGEPTSVLYLDQYVLLPTLEEYFNELPGLVKVRKKNGEKYFKITAQHDISFYDPLVLIDWVAVDETAKILAISPQNISLIELVNEIYVKGGQTYGGIISIISKKGDFAGVDLPASGVFINYRFLSSDENQLSEFNGTGKHPDTRNTLLWKPDIQLPEIQSQDFRFVTPDTPGKYMILLEGTTVKGERIRKSEVIEVHH